jgi:hypothetical protein
MKSAMIKETPPPHARLGISEIMDDVWDGFLGISQSNTKLIEKPFLPSCWCVLKLRERPFYTRLLQQMKPGSIILNRRQKGAEQGVVPKGIHTLVSCWRRVVEVDGDFEEKVRFGDKPSDLNICYFHDFWKNIYCWKKHGSFWAVLIWLAWSNVLRTKVA